MYPELFKIPFVNLTVKGYGLMMVIGFLLAVALIRKLSKKITPNPQLITNAALYSLIAGVLGARIFYVIHHFDSFRGNLLSVFALWQGGLELLGGVILAITVIILYLHHQKLPVRQYLDILAIALFLALAFGRMGCLLNGCCFGKPTDLPWAIRFPYGSWSYRSQVFPDLKRNRPTPQLKLPKDFFNYYSNDRRTYHDLKPLETLTQKQKELIKGPYRALAIHPTQLYSIASALMVCLLLYLFWRRSQKLKKLPKKARSKKLLIQPGCTFALLFICYGISRFFLEYLRDDNPFEYSWWAIYKGGTVSQNLGIYMLIAGIILLVAFEKAKPASKASK